MMNNPILIALAARGCRMEETLEETYCGNEELFARILSRLPTTTCLDRMEAAIAAKDAKALFDASHELKGLYATTALTPLFVRCCAIVEIARRGSLDGVPELMPGLKDLHREFCEVIGGAA